MMRKPLTVVLDEDTIERLEKIRTEQCVPIGRQLELALEKVGIIKRVRN